MAKRTDHVANVILELRAAELTFPPMASYHEGFAILWEEVDELWEQIRTRDSTPGRDARIRGEATQVCAMALRLLQDLCSKDEV